MKTIRRINRLMTVFLCILLVLGTNSLKVYAANLPTYSEVKYVTDNANILSQSTEDYIVNKCNTLYENLLNNKKLQLSVAVLTVDFLPDGYDAEEYANAVANSWGIAAGDKEGVLILVVTGEYKQWITVSTGLERSFSVSDRSDIVYRYFPDDNFDEDYNKAVKGMVNDTIAAINSIYGSAATSDSYNSSNNHYNNNSYRVRSSGRSMWIIILVVVLFFIISSSGRGRRYYGGSYRRPRGGFFFGPIFRMGPPPRGPRGPRGGGFGGGHGGFGGGHNGFGGGHGSGFGGGTGGFRGGGAGRK